MGDKYFHYIQTCATLCQPKAGKPLAYCGQIRTTGGHDTRDSNPKSLTKRVPIT